jgi:DNA-binding Lrp family transcriptional regulator
MSPDRFDHAILNILQAEGRISNVVLAERVNLSESACLRRVRALEESGLIRGYAALVDQAALGLPGNVFVNITLEHQDLADLNAFEQAIQKIPEVMECYLMTGEHDYLLRVVVSDINDFERVHRNDLTQLPGVSRVSSSFALRTVRKTNELPMDRK